MNDLSSTTNIPPEVCDRELPNQDRKRTTKFQLSVFSKQSSKRKRSSNVHGSSKGRQGADRSTSSGRQFTALTSNHPPITDHADAQPSWLSNVRSVVKSLFSNRRRSRHASESPISSPADRGPATGMSYIQQHVTCNYQSTANQEDHGRTPDQPLFHTDHSRDASENPTSAIVSPHEPPEEAIYWFSGLTALPQPLTTTASSAVSNPKHSQPIQPPIPVVAPRKNRIRDVLKRTLLPTCTLRFSSGSDSASALPAATPLYLSPMPDFNSTFAEPFDRLCLLPPSDAASVDNSRDIPCAVFVVPDSGRE